MPFLRVYIINKAVPAPVTTLIICDSVLYFQVSTVFVGYFDLFPPSWTKSKSA